MGFLLSGQDFDPEEEPRTPWEAGLGFVVDLDAEFVGHAALRGEEAQDPEQRLAGLVLEDRGVPRHGYPLLVDGDEVGHVTSGTMSPSLGEGIALGYLPADRAEAGTAVEVAIRGEPKRAKVSPPPFLDRD
jgi:aminomethyltransferase